LLALVQILYLVKVDVQGKVIKNADNSDEVDPKCLL